MADIPNWVLFAMILGEWCYLIFWSQTAGKRIVSQVIRAVLNLRTGRGKNPTAVQGIDNYAAQRAPESIDEIDLDSPLAQKFMAQLAERTGVPLEQLKGLAADYLGSGGEAGGGGVPIPRGANTGGSPQAAGGGLLGNLLAGVLGGHIAPEEALMAAAPMVINQMAQGMKGGAEGGKGGSGGYWG